jgi:hypothetical protein
LSYFVMNMSEQCSYLYGFNRIRLIFEPSSKLRSLSSRRMLRDFVETNFQLLIENEKTPFWIR